MHWVGLSCVASTFKLTEICGKRHIAILLLLFDSLIPKKNLDAMNISTYTSFYVSSPTKYFYKYYYYKVLVCPLTNINYFYN